MHPADVAEYVAGEFDELVRRLAVRPELTSGPALLEDDVKLYIPFAFEARPVVDMPMPSGLLGPGGQPMAVLNRGVLLGQRSTRQLLLNMDLSDYDAQPPTAELLRPDRSPLPADEWPKSVTALGIVNGHRNYARPWFCRPGLREYHTHPEHENDPWDRHREGFALYMVVIGLLSDLLNRFIGI